MKLIFTLCLALFCTSVSFSQLDRQYSFTETSGTYTPVSGGTSINLITQSNVTAAVMPIGFTFNYMGTNYSNFSVATVNNAYWQYKCGYIVLGSDPLNGANRISSCEFETMLSNPYMVKTEGLAPYRVCIIESNASIAADLYCFNSPSATYNNRPSQIRLYETSNVIEFVYGSFAMNNYNSEPRCGSSNTPVTIGLRNGTDSLMVSTADKFNWNNVALQAGGSYIGIKYRPPSGKIFRFTPNATTTCASSPIAGGAAVVVDNYVYKGENVTIQVNGSSNSPVLSYQWQQSTDNNNWTDISGANKPILNRTIATNGWYRRKVTCEGGGAVYISTAVELKVKPFYESYCIPGYPFTTTNPNTHYLVRVEGTTLNSYTPQGSVTANQPYQQFPASGNTTGDVARGTAYNFKINGTANTSAKVWLDLNRNGLFEATELIAGPFFFTLVGNERTYVFNYTVPPTIDTGLTGLRVSSYVMGSFYGIPANACDFYTGSGETEDYTIRIVASACTSAPTGGTTTANKTSVCGTDSITLKVTGASGQEGIGFQWQNSTDSTNWNNITGATGDSLRTAQNTTSFYRRRIACATFENFSVPVKVTSLVLQGGTAAGTVTTHTCGQGEFAIVVNGGTTGSYQWQQSADSANWANISGATAAVLTTSATATTFYRRQVSCPGGNAAFSSGAKITVTTPPGGSAQAADSVNCGSNNVLVTVNGGTYNSGLSFQWQSSADGSNWGNINGANTDSLNTVLFADTWYRRQTGCGSFTATSTPKKVAVKAPLAGQATANASSVNCGDSVTLVNTLNVAGHTYQWQQSTDSINWNNISGATGSTCTAWPLGTTWYRRMANCGGLGNVSAPVKVSLNALVGGVTGGGTVNVYPCPYFDVSFGVTGGSIGSYQWQQSTDSTNWNDIPGATLAQINYSPQQPVMWFRRKVICSNGSSAISVPAKNAFTGPTVTQLMVSPALDTVSCGNTHIQLAAMGMMGGNNITFTWQKSVDSVNWVDITLPQSSFTIDIYPNVTAYYRCKVSCVSLSAYSNVKKIVVVGSYSTNSNTSIFGYEPCPGRSFTLYVNNPGDTTNAVYQWQRSDDNITWTNIVGANQSLFTTSQTVGHWYRRGMTAICTPGQVFSQPFFVGVRKFYDCYCPPVNTNGCTNATIVHVKLNENAVTGGSIVNSSGCDSAAAGTGYSLLPGGYIYFNSSPFRSTTLERGTTYNAEITARTNIPTATAPWERVDIFIDFNRNGTFETSERFSRKIQRTVNPSLSLFSIEIPVPADAANGYTGLRVRYRPDSAAVDACGTAAYGETEDYTISIAGNPLPPIASGLPYNTCINGTTVVIKNANNNTTTWQKLYDASGAVVAEVNARGNQLDTVKTSVYVNNGPVQQDLNGRFYLDRNVSIRPKVQPSSPVGVRLYLTAAELAALQAVDPQANINNLNITKVGTDCPAQPNSNNTFIVTNSAQGYLGNYYLEFDVNSFSSFFMHRGNALSGVLANWQVQPQGHQNKLSWATAMERNLARFEVESSTDGLVFTKIGSINSQAANGNSSTTLSYGFTDANAPAAIVYYRLKMIDRLGGFTYSKILQVIGNNIDQLTIGRLQPNPAGNSTQLTVVAPGNGEWQLAISDQTGRVVHTQNATLIRGENKITLQLNGLAKGMYIIKGSCPEGCNKTTIKLVKQ